MEQSPLAWIEFSQQHTVRQELPNYLRSQKVTDLQQSMWSREPG